MRHVVRRPATAIVLALLLAAAGGWALQLDGRRSAIERPPAPAPPAELSTTPFAEVAPGDVTRVVSFTTPMAGPELTAFYDAQLAARGWRRVETPPARPGQPDDALAAYATALDRWPLPATPYRMTLRARPTPRSTPARPEQLVRLEIQRVESP